MRFAVVLVVCARMLPAQSSDVEQLFREAVQAQSAGDYTLAVSKYRELIRQRPDMLETRANLGAALSHLGKFDEAIEQYQLALKQNNSNIGLRFNLALAYYKKDDLAAAAEQFQLLHEAAPQDVRIATLLGDCYSRTNRNAGALAVLEPLETGNPANLDLRWVLGQALIRAGRLRDGLDRVERVAAQGNSAEAYLLAGNTAVRLDEFERARRDADAAQLIDPKLAGLHTLQGRALQYLGEADGAEAALRQALNDNPNDFEAHFTLAVVLFAKRETSEARKHLDRALELDSSSMQARYQLALVERTQGQLDAALGNLEKVVAAEPHWLPPHIELAALYYRMKRPEDGRRERELVDKMTTAPAPSR